MKYENLTRKIGLPLGPILFLLVLLLVKPESGLTQSGIAVLACTLWMAVWWITEAISISVTALLPIVLFPLTGALALSKTTESFGHKYIFLYMGGFVLAIAIEKWNLHQRIALNIIRFIGTDVKKIILGFMVATGFMSMWISNTATAVMMLPIGLAIIRQLKDNPATIEDENLIFGKALLLGIAYSASIGGMATLIGTPPNLVFAGIVQELYGTEITFFQWLSFALPVSVVLLLGCWAYLTHVAYTFSQKEFPGGKSEIQRLISELGPTSRQERLIFSIFIGTALMWVFKDWLKNWIPALDDTIIAMASALLLFALPAERGKPERLVTWPDAVQMPWGVILLFGGGMALAEGFESTGLATWIGQQLTALNGIPVAVSLFLIILAVNFLTEVTSNLATTAMILPILAPMAVSFGIHPYFFLIGATLAASCAFMLPVATPPNAVVFGAGYVTIKDMVRAGFWMNMFSVIAIFFIVKYLMPFILINN